MMKPSKVIRIDAQVWAELQRQARPLEDTPNSVLRRVFGLPEDIAGFCRKFLLETPLEYDLPLQPWTGRERESNV